MNKQLQILLLSLLTPGLGYLQTGDVKSFYKTIVLFFGVIVVGVTFRLCINFWGLSFIMFMLAGTVILAAVHSTIKAKQANPKIQTSRFLKFLFTIVFILVTGLSFANRRVIMGFDILYMGVPVMHPTVLQGERFLVDTWVYKNSFPARGDIIVHSFNRQKGLYVNRIIAIENDTIGIKNGTLFLNGQKIKEGFVLAKNVTKALSKDMAKRVIQKGNYFVMGDNRDASFGDSRFNGTIKIDNIIGKVTDIIRSQDRSRIGKPLK